MRSLTLTLVLLVTASASVRAQDSPELRSYAAHVFAAQASLERRDTALARKWLDQAPAALRNWEW